MKYQSLAAAVAALTAAAAHAQPDATAAPTEELFVIGQRLEETVPQRLAEVGNRVELITADRLELGGFNDLSQALQLTVPGLYVAPKNGPFDYMNCSLQGSRCEDVLWLVDGVRTNNRLYNTTAPLDTIPAHMIERVEVLYGGQGIFYGTQSVAGVVNVVTKSFSREPEGFLELGFDEHGGTHVTGDYRFAVGDHQLVVYASKDEADGFRPFADEDFEPSATDRERSYDVLSYGVKYAYDFSPGSRLTLLYQRTDNELDNLLPHDVAERNNARVEDWITAKWDYAVSDNIDLYIKAYWHDWDTRWDDIRNEHDADGQLTGALIEVERDAFWGFEDYGVTALADFRPGGAFEYSAGYDYQRFWGNDEVWQILDKTETAHSIYGQIRTSDTLLENGRIAFGARHNRTSGNADATVWNVSGQHNLSSALYLRGQIGTSFRLPDAEELYLRDCCEVGNPNLEPEESRNFEIGIGGTAGSGSALNWQLILFAREIDNLIDIDFDNPDFPDGIFANFDQTLDADGWEIALGVQLSDALTLAFDYTRSDAKLEGSSEQVQDIPESVLKASLTYIGTQAPYELNVTLMNVGDVYDVVASGLGRREHGGYTTLDLSGAYYLDAARRHRLGVRLENALDETYATSLGRGFRDAGNVPYVYRNLGMPRSLHATYSYRF